MMNSPMKRGGFGFLVRYDVPVQTGVIISQTPQTGSSWITDRCRSGRLAKAHQSGTNRALTFTLMPWTSEQVHVSDGNYTCKGFVDLPLFALPQSGVRFDQLLLVSVLCSTFAYHTKSEERVILTLIIFDLTSFCGFIIVNTFGQHQVIFLKIFVFDCKVLRS